MGAAIVLHRYDPVTRWCVTSSAIDHINRQDVFFFFFFIANLPPPPGVVNDETGPSPSAARLYSNN